jgi:hypothetical protein
MISKHTYAILSNALSNTPEYASGTKRKQLQSAYDKMLDEVSEHIFEEPCSNKMVFRQKINGIKNKDSKLEALAGLLKNDHLLFSKDYRVHAGEIKDFLENHMIHFLKEFRYEQLR